MSQRTSDDRGGGGEIRAARRDRRRTFAYTAVAAALCVAGIELSLSTLGRVFPAAAAVLASPAERRAALEFSSEDPLLGYRPSPGYPGHDSRGFRNNEAIDRAEIVALGDSQTYGYGVEPEEAWPQLVGTLSGKSTYNISLGGYGPTHSLGLIDLALSLDPEIVIEAFYSGNDLWDAYNMVHERGQLPDLLSGDPAVKEAIDAANRADSLKDRVEQLTRVYATGRSEVPDARTSPAAAADTDSASPTSIGRRVAGGARRFLAAHSSLYGLARALWHAIPAAAPGDAEEWSRLTAIAAASGGNWEVAERSGFRTIIVPRYRAAALDLQDARIREGHRLSLEAIARMRRSAAASGARFLVVLIPTKPLVFASVIDASARSDDYSSLIDEELAMWATTKEALDREGIEYVDTLPAIRAVFTRGLQPYPISQDGHPNAAGHRAIAELVAERLSRP